MNKSEDTTPRVTGIGGIFFKTKDPAASRDWYRTHLGLNTDQWGTAFAWYQGRDPSKKGFTQWSPFSGDSKFFDNLDQEVVINYRVVHLEKLVAQLRAAKVTILDDIASFDYGKFVHILDNDGQKVQLWEPLDEAFEQIAEGITK